MPHNLRLQCSVTDVAYRRIDYVCCWVVPVEHTKGTIRYVLDQLVIVGSCVKLGAVVSTSEGESAYDVWISSHMDLDEPCWCRDSVLISDCEGDEVLPNVVDETLGGLEGNNGTSRHLHICWGGRWPYRLGSRNFSRLPSLLSLTYTHPLERPFICWDERGCQYFDGIFVVFIDESGNLSCQRGDVRVREMNSGHLSMWRVGGSDKYGCNRCWYWNRIGTVMSMAVLHGTIASIAVSSIWLVVWVTGIIPVVCLA